jgi:NAD(P)-dependent dehydrogenase (short-subunit alcohol dehydrogenase family)
VPRADGTASRRLNGHTVAVIGGSSGIGFETARLAGALGAEVIITGRHETKLRDAAQRLAARSAALDAHDEGQLAAFLEQLDGVDHLVSTIGDSMSGGFMTTTAKTMQHILMSKFLTNWIIARDAAPRLNRPGTITLTAGTGGRPHDISATYVANLGIGALVQGLAVELAPGIRVNAVAPTFMNTPFWKHMTRTEFDTAAAQFANETPLRRLGTVTEVASTFIHLITNGFITGQVIAVDGGVMLTH